MVRDDSDFLFLFLPSSRWKLMTFDIQCWQRYLLLILGASGHELLLI